MPNQRGVQTIKERVFIERMAATGDPVYAAEKAGYNQPRQRASANMQNPAIVESIQARVMRELKDEILPLASARHKKLLLDPLAPAGAVVQAIKLAYEHGLAPDTLSEKDLSEMSAGELQALTQAARTALEARMSAAKVIDHEPAEPSIFE